MYRAMGQDFPTVKRVLELNPTHPLVTGLRTAQAERPNPPREPGRPEYGLPPGDATSFSASVQVPRDAICMVDAVVIGRKWLNRWPGQWRTTIVSLQPAHR
jgi:hypothetical protein